MAVTYFGELHAKVNALAANIADNLVGYLAREGRIATSSAGPAPTANR
jgi:hypothetical protein